jgi:probable HAF family extracellular repeat protein
MRCCGRTAFVVIGLLLLAAPARAEFAFRGLGDFGGSVVEISGDGRTVVGTSQGRPARWTSSDGVVPLADVPGGAFGVSFDGSVIVGGRGAELREAFRWTADEGIVGLGDLPGDGPPASDALGVSADGTVIAGQSSRRWPIVRAFRWTAATGLVDLGNLPGGDGFSAATAVSADGRVVVGGSRSATGEQAFRWTAGAGLVGLGASGSVRTTRAHAVSADGDVVVGIGTSAKGFEAFRWTAAGGVVGLGSLDPADFASMANGVSADGNVVVGVGSGAADFNGEAFVWFPGAGMLNLREYLLANGAGAVQGWRLVDAGSISADGRTICGTGVNPQGRAEGWLARIEIDDSPAPAPTATPAPPDGSIAPSSVSVVAGTLVSGGVAEIQASDDAYLTLQTTAARKVQVAITGRATRPDAAELRFAVESAAIGSRTRQEIALFDFVARRWVTLDRRTATATDGAAEVRLTTRAARFLEPGTLRVQARLTFVPSARRGVVTRVHIDRVRWIALP